MSFFEDWQAYVPEDEDWSYVRSSYSHSLKDLTDTWIPKTGVRVEVVDMDTKHLLSCKAFIERKVKYPSNYKIYNNIVAEIMKRG